MILAMQKIFTRPIPNLEASRALAKKLYEEHLSTTDNFVLFLEGGLGAGKTFLVREILRHAGIKDEITSPTYALVNQYDDFAHFDFYRLEDPNDFFARGFTDIAADSKMSAFVEWPDKISPEAKGHFSGTAYTLKIEFGIGVGMRKVTLLQK